MVGACRWTIGKAREWFEKAAVAENRFGKANLAKLIDEAKGGAADFPRAAVAARCCAFGQW